MRRVHLVGVIDYADSASFIENLRFVKEYVALYLKIINHKVVRNPHLSHSFLLISHHFYTKYLGLY